jgi:hypothetical protein
MRSKQFTSLLQVQCKPCTYLASRLTLSPNGPNELSPDPSHLGVPSDAPKTISEPIACLVQTVHLSCVEINTISKQTEMSFPFDPHYLGGPSSAANKIFMPMVHSGQTVHLSDVEINTVSKWTEANLQLTHVT